jgi:hypothetical protein
MQPYGRLDRRFLAPPDLGDGPSSKPGNADFDWDAFDPETYVTTNYAQLRDDDLRIMQVMRDHFVEQFTDEPAGPLSGIDVGSGANLYPTLTLLPFCRSIRLAEWGAKNVAWLKSQIESYSPMWDPYWDVLTKRAPYQRVEKPRDELREVARATRQSIFRLPLRAHDVGTMTFVAESITAQENEFRLACQMFIGTLKRGAVFAAAFMRDSSGYNVNGIRFPAVAITPTDIEHCLLPITHDLKLREYRSNVPLRDGYHGMVVATGKAGRPRS